ncbi:MAG: porin family protein [Hyphomicrobiales bacterium]|nr:porin family protein [Hyphomicrobiales bacterium]
MKLKTLALALAATTIAGSAFAADLPSRKVAPAYIAPAPVFTWTGFYLGLNAGYGWNEAARFDHNLTPFTATFALAGRVYGLAANQALGSALGTGTGSSNGGFVGGGQIGYNYQMGSLVTGLEADIAYFRRSSQISNSGIDTTGNTLTVTNRVSASYLATVRGRFGFALDRALLYVTGGLALSDINYRSTMATTLVNAVGSFQNSSTKLGWTVGAGVEYAVTNNWTVKGEYLYAQFSGSNGIGILAATAPAGTSNIYTSSVGKLGNHLVRVGLNYKFGWASAAPVVAKY